MSPKYSGKQNGLTVPLQFAFYVIKVTFNNDISWGERQGVLLRGHHLHSWAVQHLGFQEDARIVVTDARQQQTFSFDGATWDYDLVEQSVQLKHKKVNAIHRHKRLSLNRTFKASGKIDTIQRHESKCITKISTQIYERLYMSNKEYHWK